MSHSSRVTLAAEITLWGERVRVKRLNKQTQTRKGFCSKDPHAAKAQKTNILDSAVPYPV